MAEPLPNGEDHLLPLFFGLAGHECDAATLRHIWMSNNQRVRKETIFSLCFQENWAELQRQALAYTGERCPDHEPECCVCRFWDAWDAFQPVIKQVIKEFKE